MKTYFITGITGSLGKVVAQKLLDAGHRVIGFSRDENKQQAMARHPRLTLYLGDIRDEKRVLESTRGVDLIFHFAALKHVDKLEENPEECISTNIIGTSNILHAQRIHAIRRVVLAATDKGAYPVNVYGMSKGIAERLVLRNPENCVCRYGNVLASRGSVLEKMVLLLRQKNAVELTDPNMTRFWITLNEASDFVIQSAFQEKGGLKIPVMKSASIQLLANSIAECLNITSFETKMIGNRGGEKMHECLRTGYEGEEVHSNTCTQFTQTQLVEILKPIVKAML